jgi:hypothetical protein
VRWFEKSQFYNGEKRKQMSDLAELKIKDFEVKGKIKIEANMVLRNKVKVQ